MSKRILARTLSVDLSKDRDDVIYTELVNLGAHRLRVRIRSNAYAFQSTAVVERWNGMRWHEVYTINSGSMKTPAGLSYKPRDTELAPFFGVDRATLLDRAEQVLLGWRGIGSEG